MINNITPHPSPSIFLHIQKTAGSSIVDLARIAYGSEQVMSHGDYLDSNMLVTLAMVDQVVQNDRNLPIPKGSSKQFRDILFVSGHFGYDFAKPLMQERYSFTFLRDPIERILSYYYFCLTRDPNEYDIYALAQKSTIDQFLTLGLERPAVKACIWNNQAWQIAHGYGNLNGRNILSYTENEIVSLAIHHLQDFSYIGFAESFEEDRDNILRALGINPPKEKIISNATLGRPTAKDHPESTLNLLRNLTELDSALYKEALLRKQKSKNLTLDNSECSATDSESKKNYLSTSPIVLNSDKNANNALAWHQTERGRLINNQLILMENVLTGLIYEDPPLKASGNTTFNRELRDYGWDWPSVALTMIGKKRLHNLRMLVESALGNNIEGDFIETGVWRGGACIFICAILDAYCIKNRNVWLADSFEGLPQPNKELYPADAGSIFHNFNELRVSIDEVKNNFKKFGLLNDNVKFLKGFFKHTLHNAPIDKLALLRLDGDMYESTIDALRALYSKVSVGGYVIVDDYHVVEGCRLAVHEFLQENNLNPGITEIDGVGVYWKVES